MKDSPILWIIGGIIVLGFVFNPLKNGLKNNGGSLFKSSPSFAQLSNSQSESDLNNSSAKEVEDEIKKTESKINDLSRDIQKETGQSRRSPYYGKISVSGITGLWQNNPSQEYLTLTANLKSNEEIKITGWYLKSAVTGYYAIIPGASMLPFPFGPDQSDVALRQGDKAVLTKGFSPIGISFRTNKCTGYFEENRTFYPSLYLKCPLPKDEKLPLFSSDLDRNDECLNIIEKIPRCATVNSEYLRDLPDTVTNSCKTYLSTQINYNVCVSTHFGDTDFPGNEYRLYFNKLNALWRTSHDTIDLYDENNLIVATIKY